MITGFYAALLGLVLLRITLKVIGARRRHQIAYGYGKQNEIAGVVSAHANFVAYAPLFLFLLLCLELGSPSSPVLLHLLAIAFLLGRILHSKGLSVSERLEKPDFKNRKFGMHLTIWPMLAAVVANIAAYILKLAS
jgi:uncharacterized protein